MKDLNPGLSQMGSGRRWSEIKLLRHGIADRLSSQSFSTFVSCRFWKYLLEYSAVQPIHFMTLTAFFHSKAVFRHLAVFANWLPNSFCLIS